MKKLVGITMAVVTLVGAALAARRTLRGEGQEFY